MFKCLFSAQRCLSAPVWICLGLLLASHPPVQAKTETMAQVMVTTSPTAAVKESLPLSMPDSNPTLPASDPLEDPLESPYPVPWKWIVATQAEFSQKGRTGLRYYRSPSLISPDGQYAVYTRIQLQAEPELFRSRVTSVMFLENLHTGQLQIVRASSPLADHLLEVEKGKEPPGAIAILMPVSWSASGDRLLARQMEGFFSTSDVSDYAVVWERQTNRTTTLSPTEIECTSAVLLGWNHLNPEQVLFRAGVLGDEDWPVWSVSLNGQTALATEASAIAYGQKVVYSWTGAQALP